MIRLSLSTGLFPLRASSKFNYKWQCYIVLLFFFISIPFYGNTQTPCNNYQINFDGVDDYVLADNVGTPVTYTIEAWVKIAMVVNSSIIVGTNSGNGPNAAYTSQLRITNGKFEHYIWDDNPKLVTGTTTIQAGIWYHVAIVATQNGQMRLFVNGLEEGTPANIGTPQFQPQFRFGSTGAQSGYYNGIIAEIRLWTVALSQATLQSFMGKSITASHPNYSNLRNYWKMEEGMGTTTADAITNNVATLTSMSASPWSVSDAPVTCGIYYVKTNGNDANDGNSWNTAFQTLQKALLVAGANSQIWVVAGTYYPDEGAGKVNNDRSASFRMKNGVAIYGGFAGAETLLSQRNWKTNITILSGDIDQNGSNAANSYHVFKNSDLDNSAVLNGFRIQGGNANSSPEWEGGGMRNESASPVIENCIFTNNSSQSRGGGMYNYLSSVKIINSTFSANTSGQGGAIFNLAHAPTLYNCLITGNTGTAVYNESCNPILTNCTLASNSGKAITNYYSPCKIYNSILWGNTEDILDLFSQSNVNNSIVQFGYTFYTGTGNSTADPLFVYQVHYLNAPTTAGDFRLLTCSPAINSGDNNVTNPYTTDVDGNPRKVSTIDRGAHEFQFTTNNALFVNGNAPAGGNGRSWGTAYRNLQDALANTSCSNINQIWVAAGRYFPDEGGGKTNNDPNAFFALKNNFAIYGGFAGNETDLSQRNWKTNITILSGDIQQTGNMYLYSPKIFVNSGLNNTAILDGFIITQSFGGGGNSGGGMYNVNASPSISNCTFSGNRSSSGGAIFNTNSSPYLYNCIFTSNTGDGNGAAIYNFNNSSPAIANCIFSGNVAETNGGAIYNNINCSPSIENCSFSGNRAQRGGAIYNLDGSSPAITNTSFSGNRGIVDGGAIFNSNNSNPSLTNCIIWGNSSTISNESSSASISYSVMEGGYTGTGNLNQNPLFVSQPNYFLAPTTIGNLRLQRNSPVINEGNDAINVTTTDLDGNLRRVNKIDMGAYEDKGSLITDVFRSKASGNWNQASSWESSSDNTTWIAASLAPDFNSGSITIQNGHTLTLTANLSIDQTTINSGGTVSVSGGTVLTVNDGTGEDIIINNGGSLIIRSIGTGTASIGNSSGSISGNVTVERYISAKAARKFSFVSTPAIGSNVRNSWQQQIFITGAGNGGAAPCAGSSSGNGGVTDKYNSNGFDVTTANSTTIYYYNGAQPAGSRWIPMPNTSTALVPGKGYRINVRGQRGINDANCSDALNGSNPAPPSSVVLSVTGTMSQGTNMGTVIVNLDGVTGDQTLVGNPYPSAIDFNAFRLTNSNLKTPTYWTYSPLNNAGASTQYTTYNAQSGFMTNRPPDNLNYPADGGKDQYIASGQAFFVEKGSGTGVMFWENHKATNVQTGAFRTAGRKDHIRIALKNVDGSLRYDEVVIAFSDEQGVSKTNLTNFDSRSLNDGAPVLVTMKSNERMAIQTRPLGFLNDTVKLGVTINTAGNHQLRFTEFEEFSFAQMIILRDKYLNTQQDIRQYPSYTFNVNGDAPSKGDDRFEIIFSMHTVLPVTFIAISARIKDVNSNEITWKLASEMNMQNYEVQRSSDARNFETRATIQSRGNSTVEQNYAYTDSRSAGTSYYRVKATEKSGKEIYSPVVKLSNAPSEMDVTIFPNPVKDNLSLLLQNISGDYAVRIMTLEGIVMQKITGNTSSGNLLNIDTRKLSKGVFIVEITGNNNERIINKIMKY